MFIILILITKCYNVYKSAHNNVKYVVNNTFTGVGTKSYKETHYDSDTVSEDNNEDDDVDVVSEEDRKKVKQKFTKRKSTQSKTNKGTVYVGCIPNYLLNYQIHLKKCSRKLGCLPH